MVVTIDVVETSLSEAELICERKRWTMVLRVALNTVLGTLRFQLPVKTIVLF